MANYFVDSTTGDNGDNGTTMDLAWATLKYALESGSLSPGDIVWVRRVHVESISSIISLVYNATPAANIQVIGWPRNSDAATEAAWTNGSTTVDSVVGISMDDEQHLARYVTCPEGGDYLITKITDSNTFIIDREYTGSTVTSTDGAFTIKADEDYNTAQAIDDSGWTINVAAWTADADDMPIIDFSGTAYYMNCNDKRCYRWANLYFIAGTSYCIYFGTAKLNIAEGCVFEVTDNQAAFYTNRTDCFLKRAVIFGTGVGGNQRGILLNTGAFVRAVDVAIYNVGDNGIQAHQGSGFELENVNVGVEVANGDEDIAFFYTFSGQWKCRDVSLGGTNGELDFGYYPLFGSINIENYGKVLGAHKAFNTQGTITKADVVAGSGDPYRRSGGGESVIEILYNLSNTSTNNPNPPEHGSDPIFEHEFEAPSTDRRKYRYYVQAEGAVSADELYIVLEYVSAYDDTSEYVIKKITSDESITARTGADDWSQYIEVTGISPAVGSKIRIKCYCRYYHATNKIYIDPLPEVTT